MITRFYSCCVINCRDINFLSEMLEIKQKWAVLMEYTGCTTLYPSTFYPPTLYPSTLYPLLRHVNPRVNQKFLRLITSKTLVSMT